MDSIQVVDGERKPVVSSRSVNPCNLGNIPHELGAYDLVQCKNGGDFLSSIVKSWAPDPEALDPPDALIYDAPMVYYELRKRYEAVGSCKLLTAGPEFFASGKMIADRKHGLPLETLYLLVHKMPVADSPPARGRVRYWVSKKQPLLTCFLPCNSAGCGKWHYCTV